MRAGRFAGVGEPELLEQLERPRPRASPRQAVQAPHHLQVLAARQQFVDRRVLAREADLRAQPVGVAHAVETRDLGVPAVGLEQRREDPHRGRLAGAVGPEQAEHRARRDLEVEAVKRARLAEVLDQPDRGDRRAAGSSVVVIRLLTLPVASHAAAAPTLEHARAQERCDHATRATTKTQPSLTRRSRPDS